MNNQATHMTVVVTLDTTTYAASLPATVKSKKFKSGKFKLSAGP
jgi:hypothetical protein